MPAIVRTFAAVAAAVCLPVSAAEIGASIAKVSSAGMVAQDIQIHLRALQSGTSAAAAELVVDVARLDWAPAQLALRDLKARCPLQADGSAWRCSGAAQVSAGGQAKPLQAQFAARLEQGRLQLDLNHAPARLSLIQAAPGDDALWQLQLRHLPLDWLDRWLRQALPSLSRLDGQIGADLQWLSGASPRIDYSLRDGGFDTSDGLHAAAHVSLAGKLDLQTSAAGWKLAHQGQISGGEVLSGSFHAKLAEQGTRLDFQLSPDPAGGYRLDRFNLDDPGVLRVRGSAALAPDATPALRELVLESVELTLPQAQQRYLAGLLAAAGWPALESSGRVAAQARWDAGGVGEASLALVKVDLSEAGRGIGVKQLDGALHWRRDGEAVPGELSWQSALLYSLPLGPVQTRWQGADGVLSLAAPARIGLLGGALELLNLRLRPAAASGERVQASLAVHDVELAALSQTLGWPRFGGKLGGAVPQLRYADQRLELTGGLMLNVFDGTLNMTGLALERPFGVLPSLSADIAFSNLDLSLVTGTFDIGEISGRLSGHVRELRLLDWQPVAFDAQLQALGGGRISQRAVKTISSVGGGGIAAGLQASMLRLFDTFGYARLGIGCRLRNAVCQMSGLDGDGGQYTLVEGRGLPRIQIVGHQGSVDWAVLVDRLKAAASGTKPVIQ